MSKSNDNWPVIGYWIPDRKIQKQNWHEFANICKSNKFHLVKIDLQKPLENQGPFNVILHKLTEYFAKNEQEAISLINSVTEYLNSHPDIVVIDPIQGVKILLDRYRTYEMIAKSSLHDIDVFTPPYVELTSNNVEENVKKLKSFGVSYPFVCKPYIAQGRDDCHEMAIIFNEESVADCKSPCVAQTFINHNALLFKIYIVGDDYQVVERPSLKNFYPSGRETIFFHSHSISKADSSSQWNVLDPEDQKHVPQLDYDKLAVIVKVLREEFNIALFGIDIVVENNTGRHAIIDINSYPGYDGYPNFFNSLITCIKNRISAKEKEMFLTQEKKENFTKVEPDDSGFDTSDSSDERKHKQLIIQSKPY